MEAIEENGPDHKWKTPEKRQLLVTCTIAVVKMWRTDL
jgi:hypothetical protein